MRIHLLAVGTRMPKWVADGFTQYAQRLPGQCSLQLREIPLSRRGKSINPSAAMAEEGRRMDKAIPRDAAVIALEEKGQALTSRQLADNMRNWLADGRDRALLIGGPDGLDADCRQRAELQWSLSPLTLPHPLVRVIVAEQLYRAWSILQNHPYHRA